MRKNKLKNGVGLTFLSFVSFLTVYGSNSVTYAQSSSPNSVLNTTGDSTPLFVFSLGLLLIVFCMVLVLFFNREHGKEAMLKGQFEFQRLAFAAVILTGLGLVFCSQWLCTIGLLLGKQKLQKVYLRHARPLSHLL